MNDEDFDATVLRAHALLGELEAAIVRIHDRTRVLNEACRLAVQTGGYAAAVVTLIDLDSGDARAVASAGPLEDEEKQILAAGYLVQEALRTGEPAGWNSPGEESTPDSRLPPLDTGCEVNGFRSAYSAPLFAGGQLVGALSLFSTMPNSFRREVQTILRDFAADLSFALDHFEKEQQIDYLSNFDLVTCMPNRSLFLKRVAQAIGREDGAMQEAVAIVLVDVERFRQINETFGRDAADDVLRELGKWLRNHLPGAMCVARLHADCFACLVRGDCEIAAAVAMLDRSIAFQLPKPAQAFGSVMHLSVRAGVSRHPEHGHNADTLLLNAESVLKQAKARKVRYLVYEPAMNSRSVERFSMENRLRQALNDSEFVLHYQPRVDIATGIIVGLEALIRWQSPELGLVPPGKFIPVLEETGMIVDVGSWVIERAQQQCLEWQADGIDVPRVAINVSQLQIRRSDFVSRLLRALHKTAVWEIELEITESLFMEDADDHAAKLTELRNAGLTVAIDDFGTGYSSLSYISQLPVDVLKIDRSFIADISARPNLKAIVSTIITLAHSLNLSVVAEGVETEEQLALLEFLGCDHAQGFLFSPALPAGRMAELLSRQQTAQDSNLSRYGT